ncbi:MAG: hypothetical protein JWO30_4879 [Fibrobacteres bacterium]|nr:hypothetical protein [Fibrobacterota bacterium]
MKKKEPSKKKGAAAKGGSAKAGAAKSAAGKSAKGGRTAPSKPGKSSSPSKASKPGKAAKASKSAKPAKAGKAVKSAKSIPVKPIRPKPKPTPVERDEDDFTPASLIADLAGLGDLADAGASAEPLEDVPASKDEKVGLEKVMASLTQIFGGKDFMSDAELDAFLDSKIASGEIPPSAALDPLDEAQSLIYEAWNSEGVVKVELAHRALDMCADCADAYVILAEEDAKSKDAALALYRKGVEAGKRALDPGHFSKSAGKFWDIMETRPYMRARLGLAECLWDIGKKDEALEHLRELMRLNPSDDQGVRYILLQCLLESGADEELGALLDRYGDDTSPEIKFTHALWMFRRKGPGAQADAALSAALRANPHVPGFLLKRKKLSKRIPASALEGSEEEAEAYASGAMDPWHGTLGALEWLSQHSPA